MRGQATADVRMKLLPNTQYGGCGEDDPKNLRTQYPEHSSAGLKFATRIRLPKLVNTKCRIIKSNSSSSHQPAWQGCVADQTDANGDGANATR